MAKKQKKVNVNPFLVDEDSISTVQEPYIVVHYEKTINGILENVGESIFDVKFDNNNFNAHFMQELTNKKISSCTKSVVLYILSNLNKDSDVIVIVPKDIALETGYGRSAVSSSLVELGSIGLIKKMTGRGMTYRYWINPLRIFKGKRINYLKEFKEDYVKRIKDTFVNLDPPVKKA